jgi:hypothetical protein
MRGQGECDCLHGLETYQVHDVDLDLRCKRADDYRYTGCCTSNGIRRLNFNTKASCQREFGLESTKLSFFVLLSRIATWKICDHINTRQSFEKDSCWTVIVKSMLRRSARTLLPRLLGLEFSSTGARQLTSTSSAWGIHIEEEVYNR